MRLAIEWALYGEVEAKKTGGSKIITRKRPIIEPAQFEDPDGMRFDSPLLAKEAWIKGNYEMEVRLYFNFNKQKYVLIRGAKSEKGKKPQSDSDMPPRAHLTIDGIPVDSFRIKSIIGSILFNDISRFFFIDGDSVQEYANLVFAEDFNIRLKEDVETILGIPAIKKTKEDIHLLLDDANRVLKKLQRDGAGGDKAAKDYDVWEEKQARHQSDLEDIEQELDEKTKSLEDKEIELRKLDVAKELTDQLDDVKGEITNEERELENDYLNRKSITRDLWLSPMKKKLKQSLKRLDEEGEEWQKLQGDKGVLQTAIVHAQAQLANHDSECPICGHNEGKVDAKRKGEIAAELASNTDEVIKIEERSKKIEHSNQLFRELSEFQVGEKGEEYLKIENSIRDRSVNLITLKDRKDTINERLEEHEYEKVANLRNEIKRLEEYIAEQKVYQKGALEKIDECQSEMDALFDKMKKPDTAEVIRASQIVSTYEELEKIYATALEEHIPKLRNYVADEATKAFLAVVPKPEQYTRIEVTENWGLKAMKEKGRKIITNPGHRTCLAFALITALKNASDIQFPTVLDNPGAGVQTDVVHRMIHHTIQNSKQVIFMSHTGGVTEDAGLREFGEHISRAWRLDEDPDGADKTVIEVIS